MGQKVNPHGARVGVIIDWSTKWYAGKKDFSNNLIEDYNLRKMLKEKLNQAGISHIDLQRAGEKLHVIVYTAKPGIVIGKGGAGAQRKQSGKQQAGKFTDHHGKTPFYTMRVYCGGTSHRVPLSYHDISKKERFSAVKACK